MANFKTGFSYYSIDTDRYQDIKIKRLKHRHGGEGLAVYDYLLCEVYREKGCYMEWTEFISFDISEYLGLQEEKLLEILQTILTIGLFDRTMFEEKQVITSRSIQERFMDMSNRAKRKNKKVPAHINLIEDETKKNTPNVPEEPSKVPEVSAILPEESLKTSKGKTKKASLTTSKEVGISLDFDMEEGFKTIIDKWLSYKGSRGETYKSQQSVRSLYRRLYELSSGESLIADKIVEQSMANNWAGLFELKTSNTSKKEEDARKRKLQLMQEANELHSKEKREGYTS